MRRKSLTQSISQPTSVLVVVFQVSLGENHADMVAEREDARRKHGGAQWQGRGRQWDSRHSKQLKWLQKMETSGGSLRHTHISTWRKKIKKKAHFWELDVLPLTQLPVSKHWETQSTDRH